MAPAMMASAGKTDDSDANDPVKQARQFAQRQARDYYVGAVGARTSAALVTPAPFVERLVHFWSNHFAISIDKVQVVGLGGLLEFEAIRPHVLGTFGDMLNAGRAPSGDAALSRPGAVGRTEQPGRRAAAGRGNRNLGLNENLAREIMELHTLGVRTGYAQADVTEFARAMTGWSVAGLTRGIFARAAGVAGTPGDFVFAAALHEPRHAHDHGQELRPEWRSAGAGRAGRPGGPSGNRDAYRHQAGAAFHRRRTGSGVGAAPADELPEDGRRSSQPLPRADRIPKLGLRSRPSSRRRGMVDLVLSRSRREGSAAPGSGDSAQPAGPAGVEAGIAGRI